MPLELLKRLASMWDKGRALCYIPRVNSYLTVKQIKPPTWHCRVWEMQHSAGCNFRLNPNPTGTARVQTQVPLMQKINTLTKYSKAKHVILLYIKQYSSSNNLAVLNCTVQFANMKMIFSKLGIRGWRHRRLPRAPNNGGAKKCVIILSYENYSF